MNTLDALIKQFEQFPGVGARQAKRFAFHVLRLPNADTEQLSELIKNLNGTVMECSRCHRFFAHISTVGSECSICSDPNRDQSKLLVVSSDNDITPIERSGIYNGTYFVLGGTVPLIDEVNAQKLRGGALKQLVNDNKANLSEVILGFAINPDGENTGRYIRQLLKETIDATAIAISELGRGLSTGSELEYADPETIKNALENRH